MTRLSQRDLPEKASRESEQLALFDLPTTTCDCCYRVIRVGEEATHPCFYLD